jgi:hypothetical protein
MRRLTLICGKHFRTAVLISLSVCCASVSAHEAVSRRPDIKSLASSRPCLATVLLYLEGYPVQAGAGTLRLDGIPTSRSVAVLLDTTGDKVDNDVITQWSPYSDVSYFVEVSWRISLLRSGAYFIATRAELLDSGGNSLAEPYIVEPLTTALVTGHAVQLVDNHRFP